MDSPAGDETRDAPRDAGAGAPSPSSRTAGVRRWVRPPASPIGLRFAEALDDHQIRMGYSFTRTRFQGLMAGDDDITPDYARNVLGFTRTPRALDLTVHTVEFAYAPHARATLVAQVPIIVRSLERMDGSGARFSDQTEGVGDLQFAVVVPFIRKGNESSQVHLGLSAPTGEIRESSAGQRLPYDLQTGNGSWNLEWGWAYRGEFDRFAWGGQAVGQHPLNRNGLGYRTGSRFTAGLWGAVTLFGNWSASLRAEWEKQNNISGKDRSFDSSLDPALNDKLRGGTRLRLAPGLSVEIPNLMGQRIAIEAAIPFFQDLDGPQLEEDWSIRTAWRLAY